MASCQRNGLSWGGSGGFLLGVLFRWFLGKNNPEYVVFFWVKLKRIWESTMKYQKEPQATRKTDRRVSNRDYLKYILWFTVLHSTTGSTSVLPLGPREVHMSFGCLFLYKFMAKMRGLLRTLIDIPGNYSAYVEQGVPLKDVAWCTAWNEVNNYWNWIWRNVQRALKNIRILHLSCILDPEVLS